MKFTYDWFIGLIELLREQGYEFADYFNWEEKKRCVIFRHDIDNDLNKAVKLAEIEKKRNVKSTYFVLLTSDFYNVFSKSSFDQLKRIIDCGHTIGLHFDEARYSNDCKDIFAIPNIILEEAERLGHVIDTKVEVVSMHRPNREILDADVVIPGMINSYSKCFFKDFKYLSDSRCRWREPVEDIIMSNAYDRLHILTHAFWYNDKEMTMHDTVEKFVNSSNHDRYYALENNITNLNEIMALSEVK